MIDTHSHIYDGAFDADLDEVILRAEEAGVETVLLPAIDSASHERLFSLVRKNPVMCRPMMGLHPTSVNDNPLYEVELEIVKRYVENPPLGVEFCAVGEVGLDLYWSKEYLAEQIAALRFQIELALKCDLPLVIHTRDAWREMCGVLRDYRQSGLRGVMHSFSGSIEHYLEIMEYGEFCFGIGGPITYKKSAVAAILPHMNMDVIVLETDAPYLPPVPYRGHRNESSYIAIIRDKVAELYGVDADRIDAVTTANAKRIFKL